MLSKGSLTVLPVVTDNVAYNLQMQPASKAASGSSGQTNYLYVSPNLVFNPATNQLVFNSSVVFGGTATYANGSQRMRINLQRNSKPATKAHSSTSSHAKLS